LTTLAEGEAVNPEFLASLRLKLSNCTRRDVGTSDSVHEDTNLGEIAQILTT
jgi:hypothetical protein